MWSLHRTIEFIRFVWDIIRFSINSPASFHSDRSGNTAGLIFSDYTEKKYLGRVFGPALAGFCPESRQAGCYVIGGWWISRCRLINDLHSPPPRSKNIIRTNQAPGCGWLPWWNVLYRQSDVNCRIAVLIFLVTCPVWLLAGAAGDFTQKSIRVYLSWYTKSNASCVLALWFSLLMHCI